MAQSTFWRGVAHTLRKVPWLIFPARSLWRLRQAKFSAGVVGVIFNNSGEILLVEHVFHPHTPWGLPGGWVGHREEPSDTLRRELQEELGLDVEIGPILLIALGWGNHLDIAYRCYARGKIKMLSNELLDYRWYPPSQLPELFIFHQRAVRQALEDLQLES